MKANETKPPFAVLDTFRNTVTYFSRCTPDIRVAEYAAAFDKCAARIEEQRSVITDLHSKKAVDLARDASVALSEFIRGLAEGEPFSEKAQASLDAACENIAAWSRLRPSIFGKAKCSPDEVASLAVSEAVLRASVLHMILEIVDANIMNFAQERQKISTASETITERIRESEAKLAYLEAEKTKEEAKLKEAIKDAQDFDKEAAKPEVTKPEVTKPEDSETKCPGTQESSRVPVSLDDGCLDIDEDIPDIPQEELRELIKQKKLVELAEERARMMQEFAYSQIKSYHTSAVNRAESELKVLDSKLKKVNFELKTLKLQLEAQSPQLDLIELYTSGVCAIELLATEAFVKGTPAYGVPTETLVNFLSSLRAAGPLLVYPQKALDACMVLGRAFEFYANKQEQNGNN